MFCSQCGHSVADGSTVCLQCGAQLQLASAGIPPPAAPPPAGEGSTGPAAGPSPGPERSRRRPTGSTPPFAFDTTRWSRQQRIALIATGVLFISLFLPWFTYNFGLGSVSVDGLWHQWMYLVLIVSLAIIVYLVAYAGFTELPFTLPMSEERLLLIATVINAVLTILDFLSKPGGTGFGVDWGFGAFLGLIAAIVAAGALVGPAIQARRSAR
jgi:hypothetical protein